MIKKSKLSGIVCLLWLATAAMALGQDVELYVIEPFPLQITYNKTVNVIFPYAIKSVDRGSRDILAQKAKGVENILQLKAAEKNMKQTNLTVVTADGKLFSFVVDYTEQPTQLNIELIKVLENSRGADALLEKEPNQQYLKQSAERVAADRNKIKRISDGSGKVRLSLTGVYIDKEVVFYRLRIANRSNVSYGIESLRFFISDKKRVKRVATQQTEVTPLHVHAQTPGIDASNEHEMVFAVPKFTIPDAKQLTIQLMEKNGGRHLRLQVQNKTIIKARPVL
ncbi:conjugative transposon protein TraN [Dyadobacter luteus]|uniref:Conjugative transposon protein TraN n=1 Tax=Dyadobacter luteus TaxID=2259619 RepID=A0A3D8YCL6_9BACT|nr:conjugative transposon protein TraN [Dyadobacter luteus]REA60061.1 conjugative transposon protein TraN [Dyadobacter luteus]